MAISVEYGGISFRVRSVTLELAVGAAPLLYLDWWEETNGAPNNNGFRISWEGIGNEGPTLSQFIAPMTFERLPPPACTSRGVALLFLRKQVQSWANRAPNTKRALVVQRQRDEGVDAWIQRVTNQTDLQRTPEVLDSILSDDICWWRRARQSNLQTLNEFSKFLGSLTSKFNDWFLVDDPEKPVRFIWDKPTLNSLDEYHTDALMIMPDSTALSFTRQIYPTWLSRGKAIPLRNNLSSDSLWSLLTGLASHGFPAMREGMLAEHFESPEDVPIAPGIAIDRGVTYFLDRIQLRFALDDNSETAALEPRVRLGPTPRFSAPPDVHGFIQGVVEDRIEENQNIFLSIKPSKSSSWTVANNQGLPDKQAQLRVRVCAPLRRDQNGAAAGLYLPWQQGDQVCALALQGTQSWVFGSEQPQLSKNSASAASLIGQTLTLHAVDSVDIQLKDKNFIRAVRDSEKVSVLNSSAVFKSDEVNILGKVKIT